MRSFVCACEGQFRRRCSILVLCAVGMLVLFGMGYVAATTDCNEAIARVDVDDCHCLAQPGQPMGEFCEKWGMKIYIWVCYNANQCAACEVCNWTASPIMVVGGQKRLCSNQLEECESHEECASMDEWENFTVNINDCMCL